VSCSDSISAPLGPGFEGDSGGWISESCDLSAYAGQTVILAFRYVTDPGVAEPGFWVDNVVLDGVTLSDGSTLDGWSSPTEINPTDIESYTVRLIAYDKHGKKVRIAKLKLDADNDGLMKAAEIADKLGSKGKTIAAIVTFHDSTEMVGQAAPYRLTVNGVLQPGGS
jgi:hypothetical protein